MNADQYRRTQRAKRYQCTRCGRELESRNFMMCVACRMRAKEYMRKNRAKSTESPNK